MKIIILISLASFFFIVLMMDFEKEKVYKGGELDINPHVETKGVEYDSLEVYREILLNEKENERIR